jgi:formate dehydrogenase iron-sulfur subunit
MAKAILFDSTKCTACRACQVACKQWNNLEAEETTNTGTIENPPDLSPRTWLKMKFNE